MEARRQGKNKKSNILILETMKQIIWSNDSYFDDKAREYYQDCQREYLEDDGYTVSDEEWGEEVYSWLDAERMNLNVQLSQPILVVGDLGLWNGRRMGYKEIPSGNIRDCLWRLGLVARPQAGLPDFGQQPCRHLAQLMR